MAERHRRPSASGGGPGPEDERHAQYYSGIRNGLWAPKHEAKIGMAVWFFGWLVARQTSQQDSTGLVFGGKNLTWAWLAAKTGWTNRTLQRWAEILRRHGYIELIRGRRGFIIKILNAKKFLHYQKTLFSDMPQVASLARSGDTKGGESRVKGGESEPRNLLVNLTLNPSKRKAPPSLHAEIKSWCQAEWEARFGRKPPWDGRDSKALKELLEARPDLTLAEVQPAWKNYMDSTKGFYDDNGWPLWTFCKDFAGLSLHPIYDRGKRHGRGRAEKPNGSGDPRLERFQKAGKTARELAEHAH